MKIIYVVMMLVCLNGCGGADNAEPASQETLDSNSIEQNPSVTGGSE